MQILLSSWLVLFTPQPRNQSPRGTPTLTLPWVACRCQELTARAEGTTSTHSPPRAVLTTACTKHSGTQSKFGEPRHSALLRLKML